MAEPGSHAIILQLPGIVDNQNCFSEMMLSSEAEVAENDNFIRSSTTADAIDDTVAAQDSWPDLSGQSVPHKIADDTVVPIPQQPGSKKKKRRLPIEFSAKLRQKMYFQSSEAQALFLPMDLQRKVGFEEYLNAQIKRLRLANKLCDGWTHVVDGQDPNRLSAREIFVYRQKRAFLCQAYVLVVEKMGVGVKPSAKTSVIH